MLSRVRERGQGLVEYALLLFFIALAVLLVLMIFGPIIGNVFSKINTSLLSF
jgi:pilus assembly protein Flp/PilA